MPPSLRSPVWWSVYALATLLVLSPMVDLLSQVWPLQPASVVWRYGFLGFLGNNLLTPLLGLTLAAVTAAVLGHGGWLRVLSVTVAFGSVALLGVLLLFALDVLQLQQNVPAEGQAAFRAGAWIAAGKYMAAAASCFVLGWTGLHAARGQPAESPPVERAASRALPPRRPVPSPMR